MQNRYPDWMCFRDGDLLDSMCGIAVRCKRRMGGYASFSVSISGILCGAVVGVVTVFIAAQAPAKHAAKVSPVAAVSGNSESSKK